MTEYAQALQNVEPVCRASNTFLNVLPSTSVRDGFDRQDYDDFRREEAIPTAPKDVMRACMQAYDEHGLVRNVYDLMVDFAVKGIDVEHPLNKVEKFYKEWFRRVNGYERSAHFLKILFLCNNVVVRRHTARLSPADERNFRRTQTVAEDMSEGGAARAEPDSRRPPDPAPRKREIPLRYTFLNPTTVELADESVATFVGPEAFRFFLRLPPVLVKKVKNPKTEDDRALVQSLPTDIVQAVRRGGTLLPLDPEKVSAYYYKRDDWQAWATPSLRSVLPDLQILKKMKMADLAALDGAVSCIRVWKLGSLDHQIVAPESAMQRLAEMLTANVGGGVMDLVWGPDIELLETSTEVHKFLGETKYAPVLNFIFQGLGIPPTLNGTGQRNSQGYTNNYMSLQTFVERLEYGRQVLRTFWEKEFRLVQAAMDFTRPASLDFGGIITDETAEKQIVLNMADRGIISLESAREMLGLVPEIEEIRQRKEEKARKKGKLPPKAGPFHDANYEQGVLKILAQTGQYSAEELGVEMGGEGGKTPPAERGAKLIKKYPPPAAKGPPGAAPGEGDGGDGSTKGQPGEGRPAGKKDQSKRKQKVVKPRTGAASSFVHDLARAESSLAEIARLTTPLYLRALGKKTARELTEQEGNDLEDFKFALLCQFPLHVSPTEASIKELVGAPLNTPSPALSLLQTTLAEHARKYGARPPIEVLRKYQAAVYALWRGESV
jgi:hypothetical protein